MAREGMEASGGGGYHRHSSCIDIGEQSIVIYLSFIVIMSWVSEQRANEASEIERRAIDLVLRAPTGGGKTEGQEKDRRDFAPQNDQ